MTATRWSQLTDAEIDALPEPEQLELIREELADMRASLPRAIHDAIVEVRDSQSELYRRALLGEMA